MPPPERGLLVNGLGCRSFGLEERVLFPLDIPPSCSSEPGPSITPGAALVRPIRTPYEPARRLTVPRIAGRM